MTDRRWQDVAFIAMAIAIGIASVQILQVLFRPLLLVLGAVVIASAVSPLAAILGRFVPRVVAVLSVYAASLVIFGLIGWMVIPPLAAQAETLAAQAPELAERARRWLERDDIPVDTSVGPRLEQVIETVGRWLLTLAPAGAGAALELFLVIAMSAYLTISGPAMRRFLLSLVPTRQRDYADIVLHEMSRTMGGYVRGSLIDGAIIGAIVYTGLLLLGVDFPLVLALLAFLGELIPVLGPWLAGVPAVAIAATQSLQLALFVAVFYILLQQFESYVLLPTIMKSQASVPPLLTMIALVAGAAVAGIIGALLAIPLFGAMYVLTLFVLAPAIRVLTGATPAFERADPEDPSH